VSFGAPVAARPPAHRRASFLIGLTLVSVVVSLISAVIAIYSVGVANDARNASGPAVAGPANADVPTNQAAPAPATGRATATPGAPRVTTSPGELDPRATFTESWSPSTISLEIRPGATFSARNIDLDKPEVGAPGDTADMALYVDNGEYFRFDDKVKVVTMSGADVQPNDCATRFDTARLPAGAQINVRNDDLTLCINTSFSEAQRQGIKWKIVVLHVTGVSADGTVNVSLKAWNVPE
jgi:hypothetical protein